MTECFCFIRMGRYKCNIPEMSTFLRSRVLNQKGPICLFENWAEPKEFQCLYFLGKAAQKRESLDGWELSRGAGDEGLKPGGAGCSILL